MMTLDSFPQAGAGFAAQKGAANDGMRSLRDDLWRRVYDMRQRQGNRQFADQAKSRKLGMISAGLGAAASMPWTDWLRPPPGAAAGAGITQGLTAGLR